MQECKQPECPCRPWVGGGGGVGSPPRRFPQTHQAGARLRLLPAAAALTTLAALLAATPAALAQTPTCTPAGTVTGTTVTYSGTVGGKIDCPSITGGLTLTVEEGVMIGTQETRLNPGIFVDARTTSDDNDADIVIANSGTVYSTTRGISTLRDGAGKLRVEHKAGKIVLASSADSRGINAYHGGEANTVTKGIEIVTAADIDMSAVINNGSAIFVNTISSAAGTTIPVKIDVTGGTLTTFGGGGSNIYVTQYAKGKVAINVAGGATIDSGRRGIHVERCRDLRGCESKTGDVEITTAKGSVIKAQQSSYLKPGHGIDIRQRGSGNIKVEVGGRIEAEDEGVFARHLLGTSTGDVTITVTKDGFITGRIGIDALTVAKGDITVTNSGEIVVDRRGMHFEHRVVGKMKAVLNAGGRIEVKGANEGDGGIILFYQGSPRTDAEGDTRSIEIVSAGAIESKADGIVARAINQAGVDKKIPITVEVKGGKIDAGHDGIYADTRRYNQGESGTHSEHAGGKITVTVAHGATVTAKWDGIKVDGALLDGDMRAQTVTVRGTVMGGDAADDGTKYAGVHMVKGGTVVVGPRAHVGAASGVAIKANAEGDMTVILEKDGDGLTGRVDGTVLNTATTSFKTRAGDDAGTEMALSVGAMVNMRGETQGVYDAVHLAMLKTVTVGHEFEKQSQTRLYHDRARVYEALPSVLLDLTEQASYQEHMAAPRDGNGVWARVAARDAARRPASATTAQGFRGRALAWDVTRYGLEAGVDFIPGASKRLLLGLSLHARQGEATVAHGGTIDVSGFGGGGSATYRDPAGRYLDGRFSYTYFDDVDLTSRTRGSVRADLSGHGYALGLEAGQRLALAGLDRVALTPRVRLVWSTVDLEDFADLASLPGSGRMALETATSFKGRFGVLAETAVGAATLDDWAGDGGRLFGSLDVEKEFLVDRKVQASGTALASEVRATWMRVGFGGTLSWNAGLMTLAGEGFYATAGFGNTDFGGSLTLNLRF